MDNIQFYQAPNLMDTSKLQSPKPHQISAQSPLPNAPARRPIHTAHRSSPLSYPSQQLTHPLPPRPSPSVTPPTPSQSARQRSQSPETPRNDFDRVLEEISTVSSSDGSEPLGRKPINTNDNATMYTRSDLSDSFDDRLGVPIKVDTGEESTPEACQLGGSRDDPIVIDDSMEICHDDGPESVDAQTPRLLSSAHEVSTDKGDEPDQMADGTAALTPREVLGKARSITVPVSR
ncbi:hypothetical protein I7I53_00153 [Histoplasma capsulatum var. duboisii H88]|uniref:Uncharacterized protein n=1 Tax=Ajellomyces capsulatus (strain H88) TaxID=544711 RepID=A0A8A1LMD2_AJEC8|nr:hypothetical protein I7I53_00153 [Histoplasma capsulatum var. duboisii H88]